MDKRCQYCDKVFAAKRSGAMYCSDRCRVYSSRGTPIDEYLAEQKAEVDKLGLPPLEEVDRTRAFTPEEMELVRKLPRDLWLAYMERPNSAKVMSMEERRKHYVSSNYPPQEYVNAGEQSSRWGVH